MDRFKTLNIVVTSSTSLASHLNKQLKPNQRIIHIEMISEKMFEKWYDVTIETRSNEREYYR